MNKTLEKILKIDARTSDVLRVAEKPGIARSLAILIGHTGDSWYWLGALGVIFLGNFWDLRAWSLVLAIAIFALAAIIMAIKFTVRRQRPEGEWGQVYRRTDPHSFPSGHAARAMMLAVLVYGLGPAWLIGLLFIWAPLVGIARIATGLHYLSDVVAGWLIGFGAGLLFLELVALTFPQLLI